MDSEDTDTTVAVISSTMKVAVILFALVAVALAADKYTTKYDDIDLDEILNSPRLIKVHIKCLLETGKCNDQGQTLKKVIPEAITTDCSKCSDVQKKSVDKVFRSLIKTYRSDWDALVAKYDGEGTHRKNYEKYYNEPKP